MKLALTIIHVVIAVILVVVVLMQHGKQQGLSGAIAGGAETFFGKNKGRTIDAMLKKFTGVMAVLFIVSSLALTALSVMDNKKANEEAATTETTEQPAEGTEGTEGTEIPEGATQAQMDEEGNLVNPETGEILMSAEEVQKQMAEQEAQQNGEGEAAPAEGENTAAPAEGENAEAPAEGENAEQTPAE